MVEMRPSERQLLAAVRSGLDRMVRYDDESIVNDRWARQRYDCGCFPGLAQARKAAVRTAWHEAGHAVAALAIGARFSSASIHHGHRSEGRVHGISAAGDRAFVIHAAGQLAERLMDWSMLSRDEDLAAWLATWRADGGDARRFRQAARARFGGDGRAAWRCAEELLAPRRLEIREVARALLLHSRLLPYPVVAALAAGQRAG